jgi:hypothetical protein
MDWCMFVADIKTVTDYSLRPNVTRNVNTASDATRRTSTLLAQSSWPNASHVGGGNARGAACACDLPLVCCCSMLLARTRAAWQQPF